MQRYVEGISSAEFEFGGPNEKGMVAALLEFHDDVQKGTRPALQTPSQLAEVLCQNQSATQTTLDLITTLKTHYVTLCNSTLNS